MIGCMSLLDYDNLVADYNDSRELPQRYAPAFEQIATLIKSDRPTRAVEIGAGNCILAAEVARLVPTVAVDTSRVPRAEGDHELLLIDASAPEFFDLLGPGTLLYARRALGLVLNDDWTEQVEATGCALMFSQGLDHEGRGRFRHAASEEKFLAARGWSTTRDGLYLVARR